jgi:hypothetical protein
MNAKQAREIAYNVIHEKTRVEHEAYLKELATQRQLVKNCISNDVPKYFTQCLGKVATAAKDGLIEVCWWVEDVCFPNEAVNVLIHRLEEKGFKVTRDPLTSSMVCIRINWEG